MPVFRSVQVTYVKVKLAVSYRQFKYISTCVCTALFGPKNSNKLEEELN